MKQAILFLGAFFGALGIECHKYGNMYLPDNLLEWCSVRACLNWKGDNKSKKWLIVLLFNYTCRSPVADSKLNLWRLAVDFV